MKIILDKIKSAYNVITDKRDLGKFDEESRESFIRFLDILYKIVFSLFVVFSFISLYFFTTRVIF